MLFRSILGDLDALYAVQQWWEGINISLSVQFNSYQFTQASVSPEWPLVKAAIIAGAAFPVAAAVRDFYETAARLIE